MTPLDILIWLLIAFVSYQLFWGLVVSVLYVVNLFSREEVE